MEAKIRREGKRRDEKGNAEKEKEGKARKEGRRGSIAGGATAPLPSAYAYSISTTPTRCRS